MEIGLIVFLFVIAIVAVVLAGVFTIYAERHLPSEKYDEMQKINRGKAYRFSFGVGQVYFFALVIYCIFHTGKSEWIIEPFLLVMIGIMIQLQSFHIYCLMTHSALPLGEKPLPTVISYATLGGMHLIQFFGQYIPEDAAAAAGLTGAGSYNLFRLLLALMFFSLAVLHLIAHLRREKE